MKMSVVVVDESGRRFEGEVALKPQTHSRKVTAPPSALSRAPDRDRPASAPQAVSALWKKGTFRTPQSFGTIETALSELEYNFPKPTLMMALGSAPFLTRRGPRGNYRWIQKYKAGSA